MSSVFKKRDTWYAKVKDAHGKWRAFATTAKTKPQAKKLAVELEQRFERQRLGLEPMDEAPGLTVGDILSWYVETFLKEKPSYKTTKATIEKHIAPKLGDTPLSEFTTAAIENLLDEKEKDLSPQTLNHIRGYLVRALNKAISRGKWSGTNVATLVETRRVPKPIYDWLRTEEVPLVMEQLDPRFRPYFATALYTALRKGELAGLRKSDVDLKGRLIVVRRSYDRDTTKGGHADVIPIAPALVPWLEEAIEASPSELVFPAPSGEMLRRDFKAATILQRAVARAGLVTGYEHVCRKKGCGYSEFREDAGQRRCPHDGRLLWPKAMPRKLRFHDLRGTCASLLFQAGVRIELIAAILRHADPKITLERYAHVAPDFLTGVVDRLKFDMPAIESEATEEEAQAAVVGLPGLGTHLVPEPEPEKTKSEEASKTPSDSGEKWSGQWDSNPRPSAWEAGRPISRESPKDRKHRKTKGNSNDDVHPSSRRVPGSAPTSVTHLVPGRLRVIDGLRDRLLSVRDVAARLNVSVATVYGLITRGELPHLRISNAIRIRPSDLDAYIRSQTEGGC